MAVAVSENSTFFGMLWKANSEEILKGVLLNGGC